MTYLLDTGVWLRGVNQMETIPAEVIALLQGREAVFGLSAISLWEVGKKVQIGKLTLPKDLAGWFADAVAPNVSVMPLTPEIVANAMQLPDFPVRDPADELIVATARVHRLTLLTTDTKLRNYRHVRIRYFTPATAKPSL
ncbi:MAG: type II toxin-antitoxin system VapC family toxin [Verrucomicrobia bacterium]|nr:type II toxin-antitoxin system VapC family toxin [Verrucomicrobiota bacterium]